MDEYDLDADIAEVLIDWDDYLEAHGSPKPNTKQYLELTRTFFFLEGFIRGVQVGIAQQP